MVLLFQVVGLVLLGLLGLGLAWIGIMGDMMTSHGQRTRGGRRVTWSGVGLFALAICLAIVLYAHRAGLA